MRKCQYNLKILQIKAHRNAVHADQKSKLLGTYWTSPENFPSFDLFSKHSKFFFCVSQVPCLSNSAIFELCLSAEEIPLHLDTYRDKIARLQKLRFSSLYSTLSDFAPEVALRYLIGLLRVNFSPLWEPVIDIITSFTSSSNRQQFWKVFTELLVLAVEGSGTVTQ